MTADGGGGGGIVGHVAEVWRYPVKSLGGESLNRAFCRRRGLDGDRVWAVVGEDGRIGSGKTSRHRFRAMPGLLGLVAATDAAGDVWVELPDGRRGRAADPATARWVAAVTGEPVRLGRESAVSHFDDAPLHLVTTAGLAGLQASAPPGVAMDRRRFRPNLVIAAEADLRPGARYRVGEDVVLAIAGPTVRCVMTTLAQPGLSFATGTLRRLERDHDGCFGVYATVEHEGEVAVGDPVRRVS